MTHASASSIAVLRQPTTLRLANWTSDPLASWARFLHGWLPPEASIPPAVLVPYEEPHLGISTVRVRRVGTPRRVGRV